MINYNFQADFAPQLAAGDKPLTLRRFRKPPSRHAQVGELVGLWTGLRTKAARRVGVGLCEVRALVRFDRGGIVFVSDVRVAPGAPGEAAALTRELLDAESDAFARRDGFENWEAAWAFHVAHRTEAEKENWAEISPSIVRELVAWRLLSEEQAAALDSGRARVEDAA